MPDKIQEIEERLRALISRVDGLLKVPPQDEAVLSPVSPEESAPCVAAAEDIPDVVPAPVQEALLETEKAPLLLQAPEIGGVLEPPLQVPEEAPPAAPAILLPPVPVVPEDIPREEGEIPFLIGYPEALSEAARELYANLERLEPKFTKMKFHLRGRSPFRIRRSILCRKPLPARSSSCGEGCCF